MNRLVRTLVLVMLLATVSARGQQPAARLGDSTSGAGQIVSGAPTVLIGGRPAARLGDSFVTPRVVGPVHCAGGPIVTGSSTVFIEGMPAARLGDQGVSVCGPEIIVTGAMDVRIGN